MRRYKESLTVPQKSNAGDGNDSDVDRRQIAKTAVSILTADRIQMLDSIGFIWTDPRKKTKWDERYNELVQYHAQHGHCEPKDNKILLRWCYRQRSTNNEVMGTVVPHDGTAERNRTSLPEQEVIQRKEMSDNFRETWKERKAKLDELGFVWRKQTQRVQWIDRFEQLKQYKAENGK